MIDPARLHAAQSRIRECIDRGLPPSPADLQICLASQDAPTLDTLLMAAMARVRCLEDAIRAVVTPQGDDLCWADVYRELASLVGIDFDPYLLPTDVFLGNCRRFVESLRSGRPYEKDATADLLMAALARNGQLEAEAAVLRTALETVLAEAGTRLRAYHPTLVEKIEEVLGR
jgi:hypothetical protein